MTLVAEQRARARVLIDEWQLAPDGPPLSRSRALVLPVVAAGERAVLKVGAVGEGSRHEHLALQHWHGEGAVRLLRADPRRRALLLERAGPVDLRSVDDVEACEVVAAACGRLHRPAVPQLRRLSDLLDLWRDRLAAVPRGAPVPHRMVEQALSLARALRTDPATDGALLHGDLHHGHVLAAEREPWLVVAPTPINGDPHFEPGPMLWDRWDEVVATRDVRGAVRRRFHAVVDAARLDEDRARDWVVLRAVLNAVRALDDSSPDRGWITTNVTVAKAVQD